MSDLLVISYNEGEQDFYQKEIDSFCDKVLSEDPSVIIICTQKSKSQVAVAIPGQSYFSTSKSDSTKHFPHVFGKYLLSKKYQLLYKKDASFLIRGVSENNNVRTRIYIKPNINIKVVETKLSAATIGQVSKMSLNRQAIYNEITYSDKKIIIINTELADYNNGNLGISDRQKEFMELIKEFDLHIKYSQGYNIIFCGSLNFKLNPIKMINKEYKSDLYISLKKYIETNYNLNSKPSDLMKYNELKIYLDKLIDNIPTEKNNNNKSIENIIKGTNQRLYNKLKKTNELYKSLLSHFSNSIDKVGIKLTCDYKLDEKNYGVKHILKMGSVGKNYVKAVNSAHEVYKESNNTKIGVVKGATKGAIKGTTSFFSSAKKQLITPKIENILKENYKLPSMCDRILFALSEGNNPLYFNEFNVFIDLKNSRHRPIYSIFSLNNIENMNVSIYSEENRGLNN